MRDELPEGPAAPVTEPGEARKEALPVVCVRYERKGRAGKPATIISGFASESQAGSAASGLKSRLAVGGSSRGCEVLLQGDQRPRLAAALTALGFPKPRGV